MGGAGRVGGGGSPRNSARDMGQSRARSNVAWRELGKSGTSSWRRCVAEAEAECAIETQVWKPLLMKMRKSELVGIGQILDDPSKIAPGRTVGMALAEELLVVRTREGRTGRLKANAVQGAFERRRGQRNIVLKARQMGLTTWVAARFFLKTITQPGTLTLEVAHTQEAAEEIFRIVHRFLDWLPDGAAGGSAEDVAGECAADCVSGDGRAVPGGERGGPERGAGIDGAESALLGAGALAGRRGGDAGRAAGGDGAGGGADSGVDAAGSGRVLPRGVAEGRRDGDGAAFFPVVDGAARTGRRRWTRRA